MRTIDQTVMNLLFEVTDELDLDRESLQVPLLMEGSGRVEQLPAGRFEITLPDTGDLEPFLATLAGLLADAGHRPPD